MPESDLLLPERFCDAATIAEHLHITRRQVLKLARTGDLPAYPINPTATKKTYRFRLSEVDAVILGARPDTRDNSVVLGKPSRARKKVHNG